MAATGPPHPVPHVVYTGANSTHVGVYTSVIRGLEGAGLLPDLVVNRLVDAWRPWSIPRDLVQAYRGPVRWARKRIRGKVVGPLPFQYRFKAGYSSLLGTVLLALHSRPGQLIVHARTDHIAESVLRLRSRIPGMRVVAELEGDLQAEVEYRLSKAAGARRQALARQLEHHRKATSTVLTASDAVLCVSEALRDTLLKRYSLQGAAKERIAVFPTLPSRKEVNFDAARREEFRRRLGLGDRYAVLYLGNVSTPWQVPDKVLALFREVQLIREDAYLLMVTPPEERSFTGRLLASHGFDQEVSTCLSVDFEDVPGVICASDLGVALREAHPMNRVASPAKIPEYLLCGLPLVISESVGEYYQQLQDDPWAFFVRQSELRDDERSGFVRFVSRDCPLDDRGKWATRNLSRFALEDRIPDLLRAYGLDRNGESSGERNPERSLR